MPRVLPLMAGAEGSPPALILIQKLLLHLLSPAQLRMEQLWWAPDVQPW